MKSFIERHTAHKPGENPLWLLVLTCIMTDLMLFFLILYVSSIAPELNEGFVDGLNRTTGSSQAQEEEKRKKAEAVMAKYQEKDAAARLREELEKTGLKDMTEVQMTDKFIRINIAAPILFRSGKAELEPEALKVLPVMGKLLQKFTQNDIVIEGHTDNIPVRSGGYQTNWELSAARANSVVDYLADKYSIPQDKLVSAAYGEHRPVAPNDTPEGRAKNRRIEIVVARK